MVTIFWYKHSDTMYDAYTSDNPLQHHVFESFPKLLEWGLLNYGDRKREYIRNNQTEHAFNRTLIHK